MFFRHSCCFLVSVMELSVEINGEILRKMIIYSKEEIMFKKDYLDAINVFPVPDGDTGMNLYLTINRIVSELEKIPPSPTIMEASRTISKGAFLGSKGNSGVILSQFLIGLFKHLENKNKITPKDWAQGMKKGAEKAYKAVVNPKKGTILSVINSVADTAEKIVIEKDSVSWDELFSAMYESAVKSTMETQKQMDLLKEKGVVDAGAQGFVYLLRGWLKALGIRIADLEDNIRELVSTVTDKFMRKEKLAYRYCTELVLNPAQGIITAELHQLLDKYGDSIEVIDHDGIYKIHIHTNDPKTIEYQLNSYGDATLIKADDMQEQQEKRNKKLSEIFSEIESRGYARHWNLPS